MTGSWRTFRIIVRTSWMLTVLLPLAMTALMWIMAGSISRMYEDEAERSAYAVVVDLSPATVLLQGRGYELDTLGGIFAQQMAVIVLTFFLLYASWLGVRLTRALEDKGYFDVITSGTVGRLAATTAGLAAALAGCVLTGIGAAVTCLAHDFGTTGSLRYGLIVALAMAAFATLGTMFAQLVQRSPGALYLSVAVIIACYLLRGWIDYEDWAAGWTNPAGWLAEARPFDDQAHLWPYLAFAGLAVIMGAATFVFAGRRDLGGGVFAPRSGRAEARRVLSGSFALLTRLTWRTTAMAVVVGGLITLVFSASAEKMAAGGDLDAQLVFPMQLNAEIAAIVAVSAIGAFAGDETHGRTGRVLAEPVSRWRWYFSGIGVALASSLVALIALAACSGLGLWLSTDDAARVGQAIDDSVAYYPAVGLCAAAALLLAAIRPGLNSVIWAVIGWAFIVTLPSNVLDLSDAVRRISPFEWVGQVPREDWAIGSALGMSAIAIAGVLLGAVRFRRRDLVAG